jgi:hypothetical protein
MKFNFNLKFYFHYFLILGIRDERKSDKILMIKKKNLGWNRFQPRKQVVFCVNEFFLWEKFIQSVPPTSLNLHKMVDENLKRISTANFWVVRGHGLEYIQGFFFKSKYDWERASLGLK